MKKTAKRELFVFAGQSNMMGAAVFPPQVEPQIKDSYEYKHKPRRLGAGEGRFVKAGYPTGEFSYVDLQKAYGADMVDENGKSRLGDYNKNTYFCPAMSNLKSEQERALYPFFFFSESTAQHGATLAPLLAAEWEELGGRCAFAHIAKGGVSIDYYFTDEMALEYQHRITRYNKENNKTYADTVLESNRMHGAADYFFEKCNHFFEDAEKRFVGEELSNKCFCWLQGESDTQMAEIEYQIRLDILWERLKAIGFTHFFCIRVDYFGSSGIYRVMRAQERFVAEHPDAYMLTRAASFFTFPGQNEQEWFVSPPDDTYRNCRDSCFGYKNNHINEKGFALLAKRAAKNLYRVLVESKEAVPEEENVRSLILDACE